MLSAGVYLTYLSSGSWPGPEGDKRHDTPFRRALKVIEDSRNVDFEKLLVKEMQRHGCVATHSVARLDGVSFRGDIDCLAISRNGDTIWVIEAKDPIDVASPSQIRSQLTNFAAYWEKHSARVAVIDTPAGRRAVSTRLGVTLAPQCTIRSFLVTRRPSPVNYFSTRKREMIELATLSAILADATG
jgi:hypothetical protein